MDTCFEYSKALSENKLIEYLNKVLVRGEEHYITPEYLHFLFTTCCGANGSSERLLALKLLEKYIIYRENNDSFCEKYLWNCEEYTAKELRSYYNTLLDDDITIMSKYNIYYIHNMHEISNRNSVFWKCYFSALGMGALCRIVDYFKS
jgi:hypothetical protein